MMIQEQTRQDMTREKLLESAAEVFAQMGYHGARTRSIVQKAGVNIASLHYHFKDKKGLYLAVFERFVDTLWSCNPLPEIVNQPVDPKIKLKAFILSAVNRLMMEGRPAWIWRLGLREIGDPTEALDLVVERLSGPLFMALGKIVREILGLRASEEQVRLCCASIIGQCFFYRFGRALIDRVSATLPPPLNNLSIEMLAEHITQFSLAALRNYAAVGKEMV